MLEPPTASLPRVDQAAILEVREQAAEAAAAAERAKETAAESAILAAEQPSAVQSVGLFARLTLKEPVRLWLWSVMAAVLPALVLYGVLTGSEAAVWAGIGAAVLGVPITEGVRASVVSPRTHIRGVVAAGAGTLDTP